MAMIYAIRKTLAFLRNILNIHSPFLSQEITNWGPSARGAVSYEPLQHFSLIFHKISQYCSSALWPDSMGGSDPRTFRGVWQQMGKVGVCLRSVNTSVPEGISAESKISPQTPGILSGVSLWSWTSELLGDSQLFENSCVHGVNIYHGLSCTRHFTRCCEQRNARTQTWTQLVPLYTCLEMWRSFGW